MLESIYTDKFSFAQSVVSLEDLSIVDPLTMKDKSGNFVSGDKSFMSSYFSGIGMNNYQFSNTLYNVSKSTFKSLVDTKSSLEESMKFRSKRLALVINEKALTLVEGATTHFDKFLVALNKYYHDKELTVEHTYDPENGFFIAKITNKSNEGILIRLWIKDLWVKVNQFYVDSTGLLVISPFDLVDKKLDDDIDIVLDKDVCMDLSTFDDSTRDDYLAGLSVRLSVDELSYFLKRSLKLKLKAGVEYDPYTICSDRDYSDRTTNSVATLLSVMQGSDPVAYYSSYLKRAVTMTSVPFGLMADVIWNLVNEDRIPVDSLIELYDIIMRHRSNYEQINM